MPTARATPSPLGNDGLDGRAGPAVAGDSRADRLRPAPDRHVRRFEDGVRRVESIAEIMGMEGTTPQLQDIFRFERRGLRGRQIAGEFVATGIVPARRGGTARAGDRDSQEPSSRRASCSCRVGPARVASAGPPLLYCPARLWWACARDPATPGTPIWSHPTPES